MLAWLSVWSKGQTCIWPSWCHCHSLSLASVKSRLVLPFWYWLTRVVPEKGQLNGCVCVCVGREMLPKVPFHLAGYRPLVNTRFLGPPNDQFSPFSTADGCDQQADRQRSEHTHTCPFNGPLSGTTWVCQYQKGKNNLDFTATRDNEWQWHQLGHMQVCTSLQTDNHASTTTLSLLRAGCPSCHPTNSVNALNIRKIWSELTLLIYCSISTE